jgi:hypothetical protein
VFKDTCNAVKSAIPFQEVARNTLESTMAAMKKDEAKFRKDIDIMVEMVAKLTDRKPECFPRDAKKPRLSAKVKVGRK